MFTESRISAWFDSLFFFPLCFVICLSVRVLSALFFSCVSYEEHFSILLNSTNCSQGAHNLCTKITKKTLANIRLNVPLWLFLLWIILCTISSNARLKGKSISVWYEMPCSCYFTIPKGMIKAFTGCFPWFFAKNSIKTTSFPQSKLSKVQAYVALSLIMDF